MARKRRIYISLPISDKDERRQRARARELAARIEKMGCEAVNPFDISDELRAKFEVSGGKPNFFDFIAEDLHEMLQCDGILIDADTRSSYGCSIELAVAQAMVQSKSKTFHIYHTSEQWEEVKTKYII